MDDDLFRCKECGHGWNCVLDTGGDDRYECPNCGHDTGPDAPPYAKPDLLESNVPVQGSGQ